MIKNVYVVNTPNLLWWHETKEEAEALIKKEEADGVKDIRFNHSKCEIDDNDKDNFSELEVIEVFRP